MTGRRFLLMHITSHSGHRRASAAIKSAVKQLHPQAAVAGSDASHYTSRFVRWAISQTYSSLIRHQPDIWEYLYDNPAIHRQVRVFRALLHRYQSAKLGRLLDAVRPDAIACTQAYPCGMVADFKKHHNLAIPLVGVLTDYAPHLYWFHDAVDAYVVPSEQVKQRFVAHGIAASRVHVLGIPVDQTFLQPVDREAAAQRHGLSLSRPIILVMGGGGGFGNIREIVHNLDTIPYPCQFVVVAGANRGLLAKLNAQRFRHRVLALGYTNGIPELMSIATLLVSKPGGLTMAEALTKHLPMVIVNPIPGQEAYNARFLLSQGAAIQAGSPATVRQTVRDLLDDPAQLQTLRARAAELARPTAAMDVARLLMQLVDRPPATTNRFGQPVNTRQDEAAVGR